MGDEADALTMMALDMELEGVDWREGGREENPYWRSYRNYTRYGVSVKDYAGCRECLEKDLVWKQTHRADGQTNWQLMKKSGSCWIPHTCADKQPKLYECKFCCKGSLTWKYKDKYGWRLFDSLGRVHECLKKK